MTNDPSRLLLVASNRGPVSYQRADDGSLTAKRGGGGMVSGLTSGLAAAAADGGVLWLCTALSDAERLGMLKKHPMEKRRVLLPKLPKRRPPVLDEGKLRMLFERARSTRLYPFIVMAAATGCRRGELLALTWPDLDFATGVLLVSKSLEQTRIGGLRVKTTKSDEPRELGVPEWALEVLKQHRVEQQRDRAMFGPEYAANNLIFCQPAGQYYSPDRLGARVVELMRSVGLQGVTLHSLRHSHASILLSKGVPTAVVSSSVTNAA